MRHHLTTAARLPQVLDTINQLRPHKDASPLRRAMYPSSEPEAIGQELSQAVAFLLNWDKEAQRHRDRIDARLHEMDEEDRRADWETNAHFDLEAQHLYEQTC